MNNRLEMNRNGVALVGVGDIGRAFVQHRAERNQVFDVLCFRSGSQLGPEAQLLRANTTGGWWGGEITVGEGVEIERTSGQDDSEKR